MTVRWRCTTCHEEHDDLPLEWEAPLPEPIFALPENGRARNCDIGPDFCSMREADGTHYFIKSAIEIPVLDLDGRCLRWIVWASLSEKSWRVVRETWEQPARAAQPPMFGWLMSRLAIYPETIALKTMVHLREPGVLPFLELEPTEHPLAVEQRAGISTARVREIASKLLHG